MSLIFGVHIDLHSNINSLIPFLTSKPHINVAFVFFQKKWCFGIENKNDSQFLHLNMIGHVLPLIENLGCTVVKFEVPVRYALHYIH